MSHDQILRNATLDILAQHSPIDPGSLVKKLQDRGLDGAAPLWKLLEQLRIEGVARSDGPPARQLWSLVGEMRHLTTPARPTRSDVPPDQAGPTLVAPTQFAELEDPADFLFAPPLPTAPTPPELEEPATFTDTPSSPARRGKGRPQGAPRTTKYKNLTRCDYPDHSMVGYMVRVTWNRQHRQAFFADAAYGDRLGALAAALDWRDQIEREIGKPRTEQPINNAPPSNTGVEGVSRTQRAGLPILQVTWYEGGRMRRTSISITKHGEAEAMRMARHLRDRDDRPRPTLGTGAGRKRSVAR
jgi:hypothetical protein